MTSLWRYGLRPRRGATRTAPTSATSSAPAATSIVVNTVCLLLPPEPDREARLAGCAANCNERRPDGYEAAHSLTAFCVLAPRRHTP